MASGYSFDAAGVLMFCNLKVYEIFKVSRMLENNNLKKLFRSSFKIFFLYSFNGQLQGHRACILRMPFQVINVSPSPHPAAPAIVVESHTRWCTVQERCESCKWQGAHRADEHLCLGFLIRVQYKRTVTRDTCLNQYNKLSK